MRFTLNARWKSVLMSSVVGASAAVLPGFAYAQSDGDPVVADAEEAPDAVEDSDSNVISVTASRVQASGFNAPTPTQIMTSDDLLARGADNIGETLLELPAFRASVNPQSNGVRTITPGAIFGDLRGLGASRTLVLVDGNRYVPQIYTALDGYQVDLNQIPPLLVERVEVVTGGASAQWGSDAVAGVINVILKKNFEGFDFDIQGGLSERGDNENYRVAALAGTNFADGRGNVVLSFEHFENKGVGDVYSRDWGAVGWQIIGNPGFPGNGLPLYLISPDVRFSSAAPGGLLIDTALRGTTFDENGQPIPFIYGDLVGAGATGSMIGGGSNEGLNVNTGLSIRPEGRRRNFYGRAAFEFSPAISAYLEGSYTFTFGSNQSLPARDFAIPIYADNPYLPDATRNFMIDNGIAVVRMGRTHYDLNQQVSDTRNNTYRVVAGLEGEFAAGWQWDAAVIYGHNRYRQLVFNNRNRRTFALAQDPVRDPTSGQIVCRSTLTDPDNGCIPLNLFGPNSIGPDAARYVSGTTRTETTYEQTAANLNISGRPFSTWAGDVSVAAGLEYRDERQVTEVDPIAAVAGWESSNARPLTGGFEVIEGYAEAVVPLASGMAFAESLDLNGAVRVADYSTAAGTQVTWKVGSTWEPTDFLLFRAARSRDIRAPNIYELNSDGQTTRVNVLYNGSAAQVTQITGGNPNLQPEKSDTWTVGAVLDVPGVRGLTLSVDYYNIELNGAVATISAAQLFDRCERGLQFYCDFITFDPLGIPTQVTNPFLNLNVLKREGIDVEVAYRTPLDRILPGAGGDLDISLAGNWTLTQGTDLGEEAGGFDDQVGEIVGGVPRFRGVASVTYDLDAFTFNGQVRVVGKSKYNLDYIEGVDINENDVPAVAYVNVSASYDVTDNIEVFGAVENLLDRDPPIVPSAFGYPTQPAFFDMIGRNYRFGIRGRF